VYTALDGWSQAELTGTQFGADFGGFDLLSTSAQYLRKSQDTRYVATLPAWKEKDMRALWKIRKPSDLAGFDEQYYFSGGSARDLLRSVEDIKIRINSIVDSMPAATRDDVVLGYGGAAGVGIDRLRRRYLTSMDRNSYLDTSYQRSVIDSPYALRRLTAKAPLAEYEKAVDIAKTVGSAAYGWQYEALVHRLFRLVDNVPVTLHLKPYDSVGNNNGSAYEVVGLNNFTEVTCIGSNEIKATEYLSTRNINMESRCYWYPDFPTYPVIDSILWVPDKTTIFYFQITVASRHEVNVNKLEEIHDTVKRSLARVTDIAGWSYKYVAIAPSLDMSNALVLKKSNANISNYTEVQICHGYVKYPRMRDE